MPEDVEKAVKVLEKKPEVEEPWGLATWMKKKGYKMPAKEEKYKLPTPKEEEELDLYEKKLSDKVQGKAEYDPGSGSKIMAPIKAEEERIRGITNLSPTLLDIKPQKDKKEKPLFSQRSPPEKSSEEDRTGKGDYTKWTQEKESKPKNLLTRVKEKLLGEEDRKGPTPDVGPIKLPTEKDWSEAKDYAKKITQRKKDSLASPHPLGPMKAEEVDPSSPLYSKKPLEPGGIRKWTPTQDKPKMPTKTSYSKKTQVFPPKSPSSKLDVKSPTYQKAEECDDPLVYPEEFRKGMKEEKEHGDVVGDDKEALKKIVLAHLKEDPHYYTKLGTVMKAEEEYTRPPTSEKTSIKPKTLTYKTPTGTTKSRWKTPGELSQEPYAYKKEGPKYTSEEEDDPMDYIKSLEKRKMPGWTKPKGPKPVTEQDLPSERAEEERRQSPIRRSMKGVPHEKDVIRHLQTIDPVKKKAGEDETTEQYLKRITKEKKPPLKEEDLPSERFGSGEEAKNINDKLNELYSFMMWLIKNGHTPEKDKNFAKLINQYDVEKFSSEQEKQSDSDKIGEMEKPARFKAEPKDGV